MSMRPVVLVVRQDDQILWKASGDVDVFLIDADSLHECGGSAPLPHTPIMEELVEGLAIGRYVTFLATPPAEVDGGDVLSVRNFDNDRYIHARLVRDDLVEFYDGKGNFFELTKGKRGSYITAYRPKTLADRDPKEGLMLNAAFTEWSLSPAAVSEIVEWLRGKGVL